MKYSIYALGDPETGEFFYVGKAVDPQARLRDHLNNSRCHRPENREKARLILRLLVAGQSPSLTILDACTEEEVAGKERLWIVKLRADGHPLTNVRGGGEQGGRHKNSEDESLYHVGTSLSRKHCAILDRVVSKVGGSYQTLIREAIEAYWGNHEAGRAEDVA